MPSKPPPWANVTFALLSSHHASKRETSEHIADSHEAVLRSRSLLDETDACVSPRTDTAGLS
jgi:hypothetical protein